MSYENIRNYYLEQRLTDILIEEINIEIDREILNDLRTAYSGIRYTNFNRPVKEEKTNWKKEGF